jgi:hypothetical protein
MLLDGIVILVSYWCARVFTCFGAEADCFTYVWRCALLILFDCFTVDFCLEWHYALFDVCTIQIAVPYVPQPGVMLRARCPLAGVVIKC